jgi:hypothetical protein
MLVYPINGECGFSGRWDTITSARGINSNLLNIPKSASHYVKYTTGTTAELVPGEIVTDGGTSATAVVVALAIEGGTVGATTQFGILFLRTLSAAFTAGGQTLTGGTSTGTVATVQAPMELKTFSPPQAALITVETATITFTLDGTTPTVSGGTNDGHQMTSGQSYVIAGWSNIRNFKCINTVNANGAVVKYSLFYN